MDLRTRIAEEAEELEGSTERAQFCAHRPPIIRA